MARQITLTKKELYKLLTQAFEFGLRDCWESTFNTWADGQLIKLDQREERRLKRNGPATN